MKVDTEYANTDLDLKSETPFDTLQRELDQTCCVLHYAQGEDGHWHSIVESAHCKPSRDRDAAIDIAAMLNAIAALSATAKAELAMCYMREFNIGFHCGDTRSYIHALPHKIVQSIADADCSLAVTLYPMRNPDGSPK